MHVTRHRGAVVALLAAVAIAAGLPAAGQVRAAQTGAAWARIGGAAQQTGAVVRRLAPAQGSSAVGMAAIPFTAPQDVSSTGTLTPTATATATMTATATATATNTPTSTPTPRPTKTRTPTPRPTQTHTPTPRPTRTDTPTPSPTETPTPTPSPTNTPTPTATATPQPLSVQLLAVGAYQQVKGKEQRVTTIVKGSQVRLKIIVQVANAPRTGVYLSATWELWDLGKVKRFLHYNQPFHLLNGTTGLFYDFVVPSATLPTGSYRYSGAIMFHGVVQQKVTILHVKGQIKIVVPVRVHYAHLRLTVPAGWQLDFSQDSNGRRATGKDTLIMISASRRALVDVVSLGLDVTPSTADLRAFPAQLLKQEFPNGVKKTKTIFFNGQIDGHDVFAAQGEVTISGRASLALAIATNKKRQFYAFTVVNYFKSAPQSEMRAALAAIFGAKLD